ncbi:tyrosine-type recombinase/integrase [Rhodococcus pyridinivorans]|uniref:tyrosine-type recombinase/integrase n=1 Tax=Rhodococcus pyridinivorans TaxID=103816 RepID=UPI003AAAF62E
MARRQQLPPQIKKIELATKERGKLAIRYQVTTDAGVDPETGRRRQTRKRFRTEKEARDYLSSTTADVARGLHVSPSKLTVGHAVRDWLQTQRVKPSTLAAYTAALRPVVERFGDTPIQKVTKADIEGLVHDLRVGTDGAKTWKATSINPMLARLRAVMADLQAQGTLARNPAALVKPLGKERIEYTILTDAQVSALNTAIKQDRMEHVWRLALLGLRRGELAGLKWDSVDLEEKMLTISRNRISVGGRVIEGTPKTGTSARVLPLPDDVVALLRRARTRRKEEQLAAGESWVGDGEYLASDRWGRPLHPGNLSQSWRAMLARHGIPHVRLHDARHTCASRLLAEGVDAATVAAWLGHASAAVTLAIYAHTTPDRLKSAAAVLDASSS